MSERSLVNRSRPRDLADETEDPDRHEHAAHPIDARVILPAADRASNPLRRVGLGYGEGDDGVGSEQLADFGYLDRVDRRAIRTHERELTRSEKNRGAAAAARERLRRNRRTMAAR